MTRKQRSATDRIEIASENSAEIATEKIRYPPDARRADSGPQYFANRVAYGLLRSARTPLVINYPFIIVAFADRTNRCAKVNPLVPLSVLPYIRRPNGVDKLLG